MNTLFLESSAQRVYARGLERLGVTGMLQINV